MRYLVMATSILLASIVLAQESTRQERRMRALMAKGKPYPAIRIANGMLGASPHPEFYALRAEAFNRIAEFGKAEVDARKAMRAFPDSTEGLFQLALAEQGQGLLDSAVVHLREVERRDPSTEAGYRMALVLEAQGNFREGLSRIGQAIAMSGPDGPETAHLHRVKGELCALAGDTASARAELDKAVALAPDDPVNYNSRAYYIHAWAGDHRRAIEDYDRAIRLNPNYSYAFNNRGWSEYKLGEREKSIKDIQRARRTKPFNPYIYRNLGIIALEAGDTAKACMLFREALDRGFTAQHGDEVEKLMAASCGGQGLSGPRVPVQAPQGTLDRKDVHPPMRTNAP
jgi:tetratricopeptide (TPR) repeat protein